MLGPEAACVMKLLGNANLSLWAEVRQQPPLRYLSRVLVASQQGDRSCGEVLPASVGEFPVFPTSDSSSSPLQGAHFCDLSSREGFGAWSQELN